MGCVGQNMWFSSASVWLKAGLCNQLMVNLLYPCRKYKNCSPPVIIVQHVLQCGILNDECLQLFKF